jgi:YqaJ-like recombinase protein
MLNKDWISNIEIYSDEWVEARKGKMTSSKMHNLATQKPLSQEGVSYIYQKVGELVTGQTTCGKDDENIENEDTAWGIIHEPVGLQEFGKRMGIKYLVVGKLIHEPGSVFSSTPDALWVINSSITKENHYNVATVEIKCPNRYHNFIPLYQCKTPADLLKARKSNYYWQVIDQMDNCNASMGYFIAFHPLFKPGSNMRVIEFKKIDLLNEFAFLKQRKKQALEIFNQLRAEFSA